MKYIYNKKNWFLYLLIILINLILYFPALDAYFINDDYNWIKPVLFHEIIASFWGGWGHGALFRPLTRFLFYSENILFGNSPIGFHIISIIIHSSVLFLIYKLAYLFFKNKDTSYLVLAFSLFFSPFHEVVAWISAQTVLLGLFFVLIALYTYNRYLDKGSEQKKYYCISFIAYFLSLLSYESSIVFPAICFVCFYIFYKSQYSNLKKVFISLIPYLILSIAYLVYRKIVLEGLPQANEVTTNVSIWLDNYSKYFKYQLINNTQLLILFILSLISTIRLKKYEWQYIAFGFLWSFIAYIPFSFLGGYTGRFAYFSLFGLMFIMGYTWKRLIENFSRYKYIFVSILIIYFGYNSYKIIQNANYWNEAGEIAKGIPVQLKSIHTTFPDSSTLIFYDIPLGYQQSGVFLTYFEDVIQSKYSNKLNIIHVAHPFNANFRKEDYLLKENVYQFKYVLEQRKLIAISGN